MKNKHIIWALVLLSAMVVVILFINGKGHPPYQDISEEGNTDGLEQTDVMYDAFDFNNTVISLSAGNVTRIEYACGDREEVLIRELDGTWLYAGMEAVDSTAIGNYLAGLSNVRSNAHPDVQVDALSDVCALRISGNNMQPIEISLYESRQLPAPFVVRSSLNPDMYFASDSTGVYQQIFGDLNSLLGEL